MGVDAALHVHYTLSFCSAINPDRPMDGSTEGQTLEDRKTDGPSRTHLKMQMTYANASIYLYILLKLQWGNQQETNTDGHTHQYF